MMKTFSCTLTVLCLSACSSMPTMVGSAPHPEAPHWSYEGAEGPAHWHELDPKFAACAAGKAQSPIDLKWKKPEAKSHKLEWDYKDSDLKVVDNGHTIQVNVAPGTGWLKLEGKTYELVQFHFHSQSEHRLSSKSYPLEAHFVHKDGEGHLAVLAVMLVPGKENAELQKIWSHLPTQKNAELAADLKVNPAGLLPTTRTHYHYVGSLTTPPCTEGVNWNVLNTPIEASLEQIAAFQRLYANNARPVQQLHGRKPANF